MNIHLIKWASSKYKALAEALGSVIELQKQKGFSLSRRDLLEFFEKDKEGFARFLAAAAGGDVKPSEAKVLLELAGDLPASEVRKAMKGAGGLVELGATTPYVSPRVRGATIATPEDILGLGVPPEVRKIINSWTGTAGGGL